MHYQAHGTEIEHVYELPIHTITFTQKYSHNNFIQELKIGSTGHNRPSQW